MTTENNNAGTSNNTDQVNLTKPDATGNVSMQIAPEPVAENLPVSVNVGFPGKMKKVLVDPHCTVEHVLRVAEINHQGYEIRMQGAVTRPDARIPDGVPNLLIVLVKPVKGN